MTLSAILLVGGHSRRMGVDKATVLVGGEPLWQRQLHLLRELQPKTILISARTAPLWHPPEIEVVLDAAPSCGPLSGVAAALRRLETSHLLVLAIDLPQMTVEHLRKLWSLAQPGIGVIPLQDDYFEPLCAIYPAESMTIVESALNSSDPSLQQLTQTLLHQERAIAYKPTRDERLLYLNMNTPADVPPDKGTGSP